MASARHGTLRRPLLISTLAGAALVASLAVVPTTLADAATPTELYIIQTKDAPLTSYTGDVKGYAATRPTTGKKLDATSKASKAWQARLTKQHSEVLAESKVAAGKKVFDYSVSFNGFAAELTPAEVVAVQKSSQVLNIWKDEQRYAVGNPTEDSFRGAQPGKGRPSPARPWRGKTKTKPGKTRPTPTTPTKVADASTAEFLGLSGKSGVWAEEFGGPTKAGAGVIIGDLDSGIWPENASFAALATPRADQSIIDANWHGVCDAGVEEQVTCNNKLIGARYYTEGNTVIPAEFESARDYNGHGSHTAATAAGNYNVTATINGSEVGTVTGVAPGARLAVYKVLWQTTDGRASGSSASIAKAIDDAVSDGVDVINFSISGSTQYIVDPIELAFMFAADAGVFVSASAGNEGVDTAGNNVPSSVAHNSPWVTTVAAGTFPTSTAKTVTLGDGQTFSGVGVGAALPSAPLIDAASAAIDDAHAANAALCFSSDWTGELSLDPAKVAGKIVLCARGTSDRVDKSLAVKEAGGVGMILYNPSTNSLNADYHSVPTIHVDEVAGAAIKAYAATSGATAAISAVSSVKAESPVVADFSSYGPAEAGGGDLLKPDILAPGVDVIAAVSPMANAGNTFSSYSGTSMAAPHISGLGALLASKHPDWSPMTIKSALMTNAITKTDKGNAIERQGETATPLNYGSGEVQPDDSFNPGLVYDSTFNDWVAYACGINQFQLVYNAAYCTEDYFGSIGASQLNYPSIAIDDLAGVESVTRTVTNVDTKSGTSVYKVSVKAPTGFKVVVSPKQLKLRSGESASYTVTVTRTSAPLDSWAFGSLTWTENGSKGHAVTSPIAVSATALSAPAEILADGTSGSAEVTVTPGFTGTLSAAPLGLTPATVTSLPLTPSAVSFSPSVTAWISRTDFTVPAGTPVAKFATYDADYGAGYDTDIYVFSLTTGALVGQSAGASAEESVTIANPSGPYAVFVHLFATPDGSGTTVQLNSFIVGGDEGNLTVTPASQSVTTGVPASLAVAWTGLDAGTRYVGAVTYSDGTGIVGSTAVTVLP